MVSKKIYCDDLEKMIDKEGCYDAKGSTICRACEEKPLRKKPAHKSKTPK